MASEKIEVTEGLIADLRRMLTESRRRREAEIATNGIPRLYPLRVFMQADTLEALLDELKRLGEIEDAYISRDELGISDFRTRDFATPTVVLSPMKNASQRDLQKELSDAGDRRDWDECDRLDALIDDSLAQTVRAVNVGHEGQVPLTRPQVKAAADWLRERAKEVGR